MTTLFWRVDYCGGEGGLQLCVREYLTFDRLLAGGKDGEAVVQVENDRDVIIAAFERCLREAVSIEVYRMTWNGGKLGAVSMGIDRMDSGFARKLQEVCERLAGERQAG